MCFKRSSGLVWLGFMVYQPFEDIKCQILFIYIYKMYELKTHFVDNIIKPV